MDSTDSKDDSFMPLLWLCLGIFLTWLLFIYASPILIEELEDRAFYGDSFGSINTLFSGLALAGIIFTILLQKNELKLQRLELKDTRVELKRSAVAQEKSKLALKDQAKFLKLSSELAALSALIQSYASVESYYKNNSEGHIARNAREKREQYTSAIELKLEEINNIK